MRIWSGLFFALAVPACGSEQAVIQASNTLAPPGDTAVKGPVDGISCESGEELAFHLHAHLSIYVGDEPRLLPAGIGIGPPLEVANHFVVGGSCFSWLHTHDQTGILHIESPTPRLFTLGEFFDIWGQPLSGSAVGPALGDVRAFVDGEPFTRDPRELPLVNLDSAGNYVAQGVLQLDIGTPVHPFEPYTFPAGY